MKHDIGSGIQYEFELETDQGTAAIPLLPEKKESKTLTVGKAGFQITSIPGKNWRIELSVLSGRGTLFAAVKIGIKNWSLKNYLLLPAAVYGGNRVRIADRNGVYPPKLRAGHGDKFRP